MEPPLVGTGPFFFLYEICSPLIFSSKLSVYCGCINYIVLFFSFFFLVADSSCLCLFFVIYAFVTVISTFFQVSGAFFFEG